MQPLPLAIQLDDDLYHLMTAVPAITELLPNLPRERTHLRVPVAAVSPLKKAIQQSGSYPLQPIIELLDLAAQDNANTARAMSRIMAKGVEWQKSGWPLRKSDELASDHLLIEEANRFAAASAGELVSDGAALEGAALETAAHEVAATFIFQNGVSTSQQPQVYRTVFGGLMKSYQERAESPTPTRTEIHGKDGVYSVKLAGEDEHKVDTSGGEPSCSCGQGGDCPHIAALRSVGFITEPSSEQSKLEKKAKTDGELGHGVQAGQQFEMVDGPNSGAVGRVYRATGSEPCDTARCPHHGTDHSHITLTAYRFDNAHRPHDKATGLQPDSLASDTVIADPANPGMLQSEPYHFEGKYVKRYQPVASAKKSAGQNTFEEVKGAYHRAHGFGQELATRRESESGNGREYWSATDHGSGLSNMHVERESYLRGDPAGSEANRGIYHPFHMAHALGAGFTSGVGAHFNGGTAEEHFTQDAPHIAAGIGAAHGSSLASEHRRRRNMGEGEMMTNSQAKTHFTHMAKQHGFTEPEHRDAYVGAATHAYASGRDDY